MESTPTTARAAVSALPSSRFPQMYTPLHTQTYEIVKGSYVPAGDTKQATKVEDKVVKALEAVGAFQKLPMVMQSIDILYSALKKARRVSPTKGIANIAKRERNKGAKQLDALMKEIAVPLRKYTENFPGKISLHPYERSLVELTLGDGNYEEVLRKVDYLRKRVVAVGKEHASLCAKVGIKKIEEIFSHEGKAVDELLNIAKTLRAMPVVDLETPTLCLVGAPNVGKSSLVRLLSTGKPEICNYPFTTRGILMGHINLSYQNFQVTDTPEDRNNLEKLTLAVLSHLPTAVLFVHDLSGECGTSPSDQFTIYNEIKERFANHLWLDVVSKSDLLTDSPVVFITEDSNTDSLDLAKYRRMGPDGSLHVSVKTEVGISELKVRVHELLVTQSERIKSCKSSEEVSINLFFPVITSSLSFTDIELLSRRLAVYEIRTGRKLFTFAIVNYNGSTIRRSNFKGLKHQRGSSLRSTTSEEIHVKDDSNSKTVDEAQPVENTDDYESRLDQELQEGSLFDNPLKLFKFLEGLNIKHNLFILGAEFLLAFVDSVAMMSTFSSESSKMLGEASTGMSILSGYLSNLMAFLFVGLFACLVNDGLCGTVFSFEVGQMKYRSRNMIIERILMLPVRLTSGLDLALSDLDYEETYSFLAFGSGGAVALWLVAAIVSAIDSIPVLPKALELVGLGYTLWFTSRYLVLKKNRDELFARVEELKQQVLGSDD
ncbi:hypothetical protein SASPL_151836 [Salvia splendens]|uniref:Nucleolar GTP-binding protein n=1 Tax=Salvia splendens TaxID=180675 RepID=A0A8X8YZF8_SALSN|nr:hypothetical protein SASPL_151836 [Salvia splendens]